MASRVAAVYWGVCTQTDAEGGWKIDLGLVSPETCSSGQAFCDRLSARLTEDARRRILAIKAHCCSQPGYRRQMWQSLAFGQGPKRVRLLCGVDIYNAVLDADVKTPEEFMRYIEENEILKAP